MVFAGRSASVYYLDTTTSTSQVAAVTMSAVQTGLIYAVPATQGDKRFIDPAGGMTVKANSIAKTYGTDYILSGPCIVFNTSVTGPVTIEAYKYFTTKKASNAKSWEINVEYDAEEMTIMGQAATWKNHVGMMQGASASISQYWNDGDILQNHITGIFVLALFVQLTDDTTRAGKRYECYARLNKDSVKTASNGIVEEELAFDVVGRVYYLAA